MTFASSVRCIALTLALCAPVAASAEPGWLRAGVWLSAAAPEPPHASASAVSAPTPAPAVDDYGWSIVLADLPSLTAIGFGYFAQQPGWMIAGFAAYLLTAPVVHLAHWNWAGAGISFLVHLLGPPVMFAMLAFKSGCNTVASCHATWLVLGGLSLLIPTMYDALENAHRPLPTAAPAIGVTARGTPLWGIAIRG